MKVLKEALESLNKTNILEELGLSFNSEEEWIGIDLDGTAAHYDGWKGVEHIGEPIEKIINLIKLMITTEYKGKPIKVKFFTARVATDDPVERWLVCTMIVHARSLKIKELL